MKKRLTLCVACGALFVLVGCHGQSAEKSSSQQTPAVPVKLVIADSVHIQDSLELTGAAAAVSQIAVITESSGRVLDVRFKSGSFVRKGDTLVILDTASQSLGLARARLALQKAEADHERAMRLSQGGGVTAQQLQDAGIYLEQMKVGFADAKRALDLAIVKSPITGTASSKRLDPGSVVGMNTPVTEVVDASLLKVVSKVPEYDAYHLKVGDHVRITCNILPSLAWDGQITFIDPKTDGGNNYPLEIQFNNSASTHLKVGTYVRLQFPRKREASIAVPREAVVGSLGDPSVWIVKNGTVQRASLTVGWSAGGMVQVVKGLTHGDSVVTEGANNVHQGDRVQGVK